MPSPSSPSLLLFTGENTFALAEELRRWKSAFLAKHGEANLLTLEGRTLDWGALRSEVQTAPFLGEKRLILIEGILVLHIEQLRKELDVRIFVDAEDDVRIIRRLTRDIKERGREFDHVVGQYFRHVRPMHMGFVEPSKRWADIIVPHGGNNDTAIDMLVGALKARMQRMR